MQVWNLLQAARYKYRTQKSRQKSPSGHHRTTSLGYIFANKAHIDNRKKLVKQQYLVHMSLQYGEHRPTIGWDPFVSLGHPCKFQRVSRLGTVTARHLVVGVSQTLRRWTEGATYVRQGDHHVGHWPIFLVLLSLTRWNLNRFSQFFTAEKEDNCKQNYKLFEVSVWVPWLRTISFIWSMFSSCGNFAVCHSSDVCPLCRVAELLNLWMVTRW